MAAFYWLWDGLKTDELKGGYVNVVVVCVNRLWAPRVFCVPVHYVNVVVVCVNRLWAPATVSCSFTPGGPV